MKEIKVERYPPERLSRRLTSNAVSTFASNPKPAMPHLAVSDALGALLQNRSAQQWVTSSAWEARLVARLDATRGAPLLVAAVARLAWLVVDM